MSNSTINEILEKAKKRGVSSGRPYLNDKNNKQKSSVKEKAEKLKNTERPLNLSSEDSSTEIIQTPAEKNIKELLFAAKECIKNETLLMETHLNEVHSKESLSKVLHLTESLLNEALSNEVFLNESQLKEALLNVSQLKEPLLKETHSKEGPSNKPLKNESHLNALKDIDSLLRETLNIESLTNEGKFSESHFKESLQKVAHKLESYVEGEKVYDLIEAMNDGRIKGFDLKVFSAILSKDTSDGNKVFMPVSTLTKMLNTNSSYINLSIKNLLEYGLFADHGFGKENNVGQNKNYFVPSDFGLKLKSSLKKDIKG